MRTGMLFLVLILSGLSLSFGQVNTESLRGGNGEGFKGKIGAGFESHTGNTEYTKSHAKLRVDYYADSWESFLVGSYILGQKK